jgi:hypothetical protein
MTHPDLTMRERKIVEAFRHVVEQHARGVAEAESRLAGERQAAEEALNTNRAEAQTAWRSAEVEARERRDAAVGAANATLARVRDTADSRVEAIRSLCEGAHIALGLADLRYMEEAALVMPPSNRPEADPERELARCALEAQKAGKRVESGSQQIMDERFKRRRLYPRVASLAVMLLLASTFLVQQGVRPCGWLQTATGHHQGCTQTLGGDSGPVQAVAFAPDSRLLASASADRTLRLWTLAKDKARFARSLRGHEGAVEGVAVSPDGRLLASAADDLTVKLWNPTTGQELRTLTGHTAPILAVAFAPDGRTLVSAGADGAALVWDTASGQPLLTLGGHTGAVRAVAFSPDGRAIATADDDGSVRLWDAAAGRQLRQMQAHAGGATSVAFSPDGRTVASGGADGVVKLWNAADGTLLRAIAAHRHAVRGVAFSPDGRTLASGSEDRSVKLWNVATGKNEHTLHAGSHVRGVAFSRDGRYLAWAEDSRAAQIWNVR